MNTLIFSSLLCNDALYNTEYTFFQMAYMTYIDETNNKNQLIEIHNQIQ